MLPDTLSLDQKSATLEPANTAAQNVKTSHTFTVTVTSNTTQQPKAGAKVTIKADVKANSGGHDHHDTNRPKGYLGNNQSVALCDPNAIQPQACITGTTDDKGQFSFTFTSTEVSGEHTVIATCDVCGGNQDQANVTVKVAGLRPISPSGLYALYEANGSVIGAVQGRHTSNHYLTTIAANRLLVLAINYHHLHPKDPVLHVNDASLMWGGKFDIAGKWSGYHYEHDRGVVVDIRANTTVGNIPETNFIDFENMATKQGLDAQLHCSPTRDPSIDNCLGDINRHYHVILN